VAFGGVMVMIFMRYSCLCITTASVSSLSPHKRVKEFLKQLSIKRQLPVHTTPVKDIKADVKQHDAVHLIILQLNIPEFLCVMEGMDRRLQSSN